MGETVLKWVLIGSAIVLGLFSLAEIGLRLIWGFGNPPLYIADDTVGYRLAPNQNVHRFGNQIVINQYSMRNHPIAAKPNVGSIRVLVLGDSIANGSWWTDQQETIPALMQNQLESKVQLEILNASANSWGPRNQLAYLRQFGLFEAKILVLLMNTDDLFAIAPQSFVVGRDRNYPEKKPVLALIEAGNYFLFKPQPIAELNNLNNQKEDRVGANVAAVKAIYEITKKQQIKLIIAITPLLREIAEPPRAYETRARKRLQEAIAQENITFIDFLALFQTEKVNRVLYRDRIHLTKEGNKLVSETLSHSLEKLAHQETLTTGE